jgi:hypothetical protein
MNKRNKKIPFGTVVGQLSTPDQARLLARKQFLDEIQRIAPQILDELFDLGPLYRCAPEADRWPSWKTYAWLLPSVEPLHNSTIDFDVRSEHEFVVKLYEWGTKYHLTDEWVLTWALHAVQILSQQQQGPVGTIIIGDSVFETYVRPLKTMHPSTFLMEMVKVPFETEPPEAFDPLFQTKESYLKYIDQYVEQIEKLYLEHQVAQKSSHVKSLHCKWLVQYQCMGLRWEEIEDRGDGSQIRKPATELARTIGITLRQQGKRGRPKKE